VTTRHVPTALALALVAVPLASATAQQGNDRVVQAMTKQGGAASPAACKAGFATGGKVGDGLKDLRSSMSEKDPAKRAYALGQAQKKLSDAAGNEPKNASAWLYLGRAYLYQGDLPGADSAFTKAEALAPDCKEDVQRYRQAAWVPLVNDGVDFVKADKTDSAAALFRAANTIYRGQPNGFAGLGVIFANQGQTDSAIVYLKKAADVANEANLPEDRNNATLNLGILLTRAKRYDEAVKALEQYRTWAPNDTSGAKQLAVAYRGAGQTDKAEALEKQFGIAPSEVAGSGAATTAAFNQGVEAFNAGKFGDAGTLFGQVFEKQPYNHDALLNQATAYFKGKDGRNLVTAATKLTELEPMNELAVQLLEQGYRMTQQTDKQVATVSQRRMLPVKVESKGVAISPSDLKLTMTATGRDARDAKDRPIKPAPVALTFELLGQDGSVLSTQNVTVPPLTPDATHEFTVEAKANGINGWRYKAAK
jgi:tetratricopeptide (TPR) repeat protein